MILLRLEVAEVVKQHQEARAEIDDATVRRFMDPTREELRSQVKALATEGA